MLIATCLILSLVDAFAAIAIILKYTKEMEIEEFVCRAPLDEFLRVRGRMQSCFLMLELATILSTNGVLR